MAACAIALASIPTFYSLVGFIIFAIGVSIYEFRFGPRTFRSS